MLGIGIDITKVSRFKDPSQLFLERVLHVDEIKEYFNSKNKPKYLASKWAIKEALFKADNNLINYNKIMIKKSNGIYKYKDFSISTSTEDNYYIAIVKRKG